MKMICLFHSSTFEVCDHNVVITWFIRTCSATTDLSLATLLKTAVFVPFFKTRNAFIKTRNRCIFLHPNQTGDFSDVHCSFASIYIYIYIFIKYCPLTLGVDRLSAWPIIGADIKHFTDYRYRPFSKHICRYILKKNFYRIFFFFFYNANKHTIYRWHYLLVNK